MPVRRMLVPLALLLLIALPAGARAQAPRSDPLVEAARQVTTSPNPVRLHVSPAVAVHPEDASTVAVAVQDLRNGGCGLHVSRDGGLTWAQTATNLLTAEYQFCGQREFGPTMAVAFAPDGTLYTSFGASRIERHPNGPVDQVLVRTTDLGLTHRLSVVAASQDYRYTPEEGPPETGFTQNRYTSLAIDPSNPNRVYVGWRQGVGGVSAPFGSIPVRSFVAVSGDGGRTWGEPVDVTASFRGDELFGSDVPMLAVASDGTAYAFTKERPRRPPEGDPPPSRLLMFRSTDGGRTWAGSAVNEGAATITNPDAVVDPVTGDLYVVYDARIGEGDAVPSNVWFVRSSDGGHTWTDPVDLTDDDPAKGYNQYFPGISVAPNGRIDVAWWDFRHDPFFVPEAAGGMNAVATERYTDVYMVSSSNRGRNWGANVRVTDRTIDTRIGVTFNNQDVRAPIGTASTDDAAYVTWPDSRAGRADLEAEDAYFSRVRFETTAAPAGTMGGDSKLVWSLIGAGGALAVGGLILVMGTGAARRRAGAPAAASEAAGSGEGGSA